VLLRRGFDIELSDQRGVHLKPLKPSLAMHLGIDGCGTTNLNCSSLNFPCLPATSKQLFYAKCSQDKEYEKCL